MYKKELRPYYKSLRNKLTPESISSSSIAIANFILRLPIWEFNYYHLFLSIASQKEIDTTPVLSILQGKDKNIVLPKVLDNTNLSHFLLTDSTVLKTNRWDIPEPVDGIEILTRKIDVVFIPLLAFDTKGNRVGYGKGFYDRFLKDCRPEVVKIGFSFFEAEEKISDVDDTDIPLDYCITPLKIYSFSS